MVGVSVVGGAQYATEWSDGGVVNLGSLASSTDSVASSINDAGQAVGWSFNNGAFAAEWNGDTYINLGGLYGFTSFAQDINAVGQAVGYSVGSDFYATEWDGDAIVGLGPLPGFASSLANGINDDGQVVGWSFGVAPRVPEPSTWLMMLVGFGGLGLAGYRLRST